MFDARDEQRVRDLCFDIFGTDGTPCELVTMRCVPSYSLFEHADDRLFLAGRLVAKAFGCDDQRPRLGDGVIVVSGRFKGGGSRKSPCCTWKDDTVFELRDVPLAKAEAIRAKHPELVELLGSPVSPAPAEVEVHPHVQALMDERAKLAARLSEIDAELLKAYPAKRDVPVFEVANELRDED